jgi:tetratricopeptide (TPR) repeat protein
MAMEDLVEELTNRVQAGEAVDVEAYAARHPEHAQAIRDLFPALQVLGAMSGSGAPSQESANLPAAGTLGDFRLIREVGRGGMGVVYEAEQISLGRRVALKVLPFAATLDPRHLQRFHNEARAAASLDHPHIVKVHAVGQERGVHYYAMQFIDGQTLAAFIDQQRARGTADQPTAASPAPPAADTAPVAAAATEPAPRDRAYFRRAAEWGIQAAEALEQAHQLGVFHRDIKPANLMLDGRGQLWVADFGLARTAADSGLTLTGDLVGTLRYMSPEQALAQRVVIDHRTDVYSLGATLYELLALRPAFSGADRQELLRQIAFEEPVRLRRVNRAIPAELETIVLKALEKNPQERYATAQELADDLRHWLKDQPIRARRPSLMQRARRWARRHRALMVAAAAVLVISVAVLGGSVGWVASDRAARQAKTAEVAEAGLEEVARLQQRGRVPEALVAARRLAALLERDGAEGSLRRRVDARVADLALLDKLENVRLEMTADKDGHFDWEGANALYGQTFRDAGLDVEALPEGEAAERIRQSTVAAELAAVLSHWAVVRWEVMGEGDASAMALVRVARLADPGNWGARVQEALERKDGQALLEVTSSEEVLRLPRTALIVLGTHLLRDNWARGQAEAFLRQAQRQYPDDFWLSYNLLEFFRHTQPPDREEALRFAAVALALRPDSLPAHINLGVALAGNGRLDEAIAEYHEALRLKMDDPGAHNNLGNALRDKGDLGGAIAEYREAIRLKKDYAEAHNNLGNALCANGELDGAIGECREAIRLKKDLAEAHANLGNALRAKGDLGGAIAECREAVRLKKDNAEAHNSLGAALHKKGELGGAIAEYREALRLQKDYAEAHNNLGIALRDKGDLGGAIAECREAIRLKKDLAEAHNNLASTLLDQGRPAEAEAVCRKAIEIKPDLAEVHANLGNALAEQGKLAEAVVAYQKAIAVKPDFADAYTNLGNALSRQGKPAEAVAACQKAIALKPEHAMAHYNLGNALAAQGRPAEAEAAFQKAIALKPDYADAHCNLGTALAEQGKLAEAAAACQKAIALKPHDAYTHCNLGRILRDNGQFVEALTELRRGHELGAKQPGWALPSARLIRECEREVELDRKLPALLKGETKPADAAERLTLAFICTRPSRQLYGAATLFYADSFAAEPRLVGEQPSEPRYDAACAAALAGCGQGKDADQSNDKERARLRRQALEWLRADLAAYRRLLEKEPDKAGPLVRERMQHWQQDTDFAGVRGTETLAKLPEAERLEWQNLWADVADALARAERKAAPEKKSPTK